MANEPRELSKAALGITEGLPLEASNGGVDDLRKDIQRLMDMEAIRQAKHTYFRCIDTANWVELTEILHEQLYVHYKGGNYEFKLENKQDFLAAMKVSFHNEAAGRHFGCMPEIQILSENEATGIWYLYDHFWSINNKHLTHGTAIYWDKYVKENGRWLIKETSYERVYEMNESYAEAPEFSSRYLKNFGADPV